MDKKIFALVAAVFLVGGFAMAGFAQDSAQTPLQKIGQLKVTGTQLTDMKGNPVELHGMSLFDTTSYGQLVNPQSLAWMRDDWKANVVRAAMYTEYNGQFVGTSAYKEVFRIIQAAVDTGMYVVVDWHVMSDGSPLKHKEEAKDFFSQVATQFGKYHNVIYEICNEPQGGNVTWPNAVKPYAMEIIPVIRAIDPDGIILVGSPQWSSQPHIASADPVPFKNIMYVIHFYAGTNVVADSMASIDKTIANGAGIFVSEWGASNANVLPGLYFDNSIRWVKELAKRKISWCNWSLSTKLEATSALKPNANLNGSWRNGELTDSGLFLRSLIRNERSGVIFADGFDSGNFKAGNWILRGARLDSSENKEGVASLRFEGVAAITQRLKGGKISDVAVSCWYKTKAVGKSDALNFDYSLDGESWKPFGSIKAGAASADWKKLELRLPASAQHVPELQIRLSSGNASENAKFWVDEFEISATRDEM